jgi:outer membrane lipoprotein-sorting protein
MTDEILQMEIPKKYQQNAVNHLAAMIADKKKQQFDRLGWTWHKVFSPLTSWIIAGATIAILIVNLLMIYMPKDSAYAEVKQALDKARSSRYIHSIGKLGESWVEPGKFSINKSKIGDDDDITMYEAGKSYRYYKRLNKVFVYDEPSSSIVPTSENLFREFKTSIEKSDSWSKTAIEFRGQKVDLYRATRTIEHEANPMRLQCWIDPVSQRILRIEWTVEGSKDEELNYNWHEFDYPDDIPKTLFEVGVPKDANFLRENGFLVK